MTTALTFAFVIPCFNEEDNVRPTVGSVREAMGSRDDYEIILVSDASTDRTLERMQALAVADSRMVTRLRRLLQARRPRCDCDLRHDAGDDGFPGQSIAGIVSHAGKADIIIPIVTNPGARSRFRAFASKGFTTLLNWMFWLNVGYYNGAVLQRNELLRSIEITTNSFAYQAEALVKLIARGATYKHCHVRIQERTRSWRAWIRTTTTCTPERREVTRASNRRRGNGNHTRRPASSRRERSPSRPGEQRTSECRHRRRSALSAVEKRPLPSRYSERVILFIGA